MPGSVLSVLPELFLDFIIVFQDVLLFVIITTPK